MVQTSSPSSAQTDRYTLHVDDLSYELEPGTDVEKVVSEIELCMQEGKIARIPIQDSSLDGHVAFVNPAQARVVYLSHAIVRVPRIGKPSGS